MVNVKKNPNKLEKQDDVFWYIYHNVNLDSFVIVAWI